MNIEKKIELLKSKLNFCENYIPVNNMGKWSTRIDSIIKKNEILNLGIDIEIDEFNIDK